MAVEIPIAKFAAFTEEVTLENVPYRFQFVWNSRNEFWSMTILNRDLVPLVEGIKIVLLYPLIELFPDRGLPPGEIMAVDTTDEETKVTRENLGNTVSLIYLTKAERDAI